MNRIVGLETEYGCLTNDPSGPPSAVGRVRNWIFEKNRFGLADMHQRDWDEPAGNGGFLFNGGRAYVDMGHLEYCTPECLSLIDLLRYDRAGDAILLQALKEMHLSEQVSFIRESEEQLSRLVNDELDMAIRLFKIAVTSCFGLKLSVVTAFSFVTL